MVTFQIRKTTYRNRDGFLVLGCGQGSYNTKIFTTSRSSAEHIRTQLRADERYMTTSADFLPRD